MDKKFNIGDVVYVSGNVRYKDEVGEIVDLGRNGDFVVVKLYAVDGNKSFHASDLTAETDEQTEKREEREEEQDDEVEIYFSFYDQEEHKGWVGKVRRSEEDGRTKWREVRLKDEKSDRDWGNSTYMSYLSPSDLMTWVEKDYGNHYDVRGPFDSRQEARDYMKRKYYLDESVINEAAKFKPGDKVHMGFATRNGSGVAGTLEKIENGLAYVKVKKGSKEELVKGHAAYLTHEANEAANSLTVEQIKEDLQDMNLASCDLLEAWISIQQLYPNDEAESIFESLKAIRAQLNEAVIEESEFLQRMLKHVSDKRDMRNSNRALDNAAIADAKKVSKGKKSFDGINYKNDVTLMKDLLARGKKTAKKEKDLAKQYDMYNKQEEKGKTPKLPVGIKMYQDYISKGKSIPGGRVVNHSTTGYSEEDDDGDGGDGRLTPTNNALQATVEHFHNFLHHIAEEELLSCKVIHFEAEGDKVVFYAECRDDPRSEGFQRDLTDKLQVRLNRHTFPGIGVVKCKVIHVKPATDKIAK